MFTKHGWGSWLLVVCFLVLTSNDIAVAQSATPFQIVGHIEKFCLLDQLKADGSCPEASDIKPPINADPFIESRIVVNGITIIVPRNLVVQMPAAYKTSQEIFAQTPVGSSTKNNSESGLALRDKQPPLAAFEALINGNIVCTSPTSCRYIAGLISISQQALNNSAGYIHQIDLDGSIFVGANPNANTMQPGDVRLRLNEPKLPALDPASGTGRYGPSNEQQFSATLADARYPDPRFQVDQGNPTVHALTGYPMCVPRSVADLECPQSNRPRDPVTNRHLTTFVVDTVDLPVPRAFGGPPITKCPGCNAREQAPFAIGDYVTYAGTLANSGPVPAPGAQPIPGELFISVHTLVANVGIYTKPGVDPAYTVLDGSLIGTLGPTGTCATLAECQDRIKVEGFTTDPSRTVNVYAIDVVPPPGAAAGSFLRLLHSTAKAQAVFGRFRWITGKSAGVLFDSSGTTKGATRELVVRIDGASGPLPDGTPLPGPPSPTVANGLTPGVYIAPVGEYIFPEPTAVQGRGPLPRLNFQCLAFLVNGWSLDGTTTIGPLSPWPGGLTTPITLNCTN